MQSFFANKIVLQITKRDSVVSLIISGGKKACLIVNPVNIDI
jgi:hypothetical protein